MHYFIYEGYVFVTWTMVCCSWTCSGVSFDTYACTCSVPFWYFTIEERIHWNFKKWLMCLSSVSRCIVHALFKTFCWCNNSSGDKVVWLIGAGRPILFWILELLIPLSEEERAPIAWRFRFLEHREGKNLRPWWTQLSERWPQYPWRCPRRPRSRRSCERQL